jgi:hypothetical protein
MVDLHPTLGKTSDISTSPPIRTSALYRKRPAEFGQMGRATAYNSTGEYFTPVVKPHYYQLAAWDNARRSEPIIFDGIRKIALSVKAKIGKYSHTDKNITKFVQANLKGVSKWIYDATVNCLWSGFSTQEIIWGKKKGPNGIDQTWIEDVISYHPSQVDLKLNLHGRLTHGEAIPTSNYLTGVWVPVPLYYTKERPVGPNFTGSMVRLPKSKVIHCSLGGEGNNPYGTSVLVPILKYHLFKEAFRDMMAIALDRYGTPLIWAVVPPQNTDEIMQDLDGTTRYLTLHEMAARELENMRSETGIVFTQIDKDHPVKLEALTTGNNFADSFQQAIELCDENMMRGMSIPNLIMKDGSQGLGTGGASERQVELFHMFVDSIFEVVINSFLEQCVAQLIQYNFDARDNFSAYDSGTITAKPFRYSDVATISGVLTQAEAVGGLNLEEEVDYQYYRDIISAPQREMTAADKANIKKIKEAATAKPVSAAPKAKSKSRPTKSKETA